jgi:hypothetical protein
MQTAKPNLAAVNVTRANNDVNVPMVSPPLAGRGPGSQGVPVNKFPDPNDWEWRMQSREGSIRFRRGPDDPRVA